MARKIFYIVCLLLLQQVAAHAQVNAVIKKAQAYYFVTFPGQFPKYPDEIESIKDEKHAQTNNTTVIVKPDTAIVIYLETITDKIAWTEALQGKQHYNVTAIPLKDSLVTAGFLKNGRQVILTKKSSNHFFVLQLSRKGKNIPQHFISAPLSLKGKYKGKVFVYKTPALKEIVPMPAS